MEGRGQAVPLRPRPVGAVPLAFAPSVCFFFLPHLKLLRTHGSSRFQRGEESGVQHAAPAGSREVQCGSPPRPVRLTRPIDASD